ncbi:Ig-like domain-containing protein, partial [Chromatium okenii]|uniref:Ig-like domain-containing protein n=1 Tax=Chromatium okenii TaxID=61644 RepID=UPI0026EF8858
MYTNDERLVNMANLPLNQINTQSMVLLLGALNALSGAEIATLGSVRLVELINTVNLDFSLVPDDKIVDILINLPIDVIPQLQSAVATRIINALSTESLATLPENPRVALIQASKLATVTTLTSVPNSSTYGSSITFTATVSPSAATGTVDFKDNGISLTGCSSQPLSGGSATCATASLSVGVHTVTAAYGGDSHYLISTGNLIQTVSSGYSPPPDPPITPPIIVTPPVIEPPIVVTPPIIETPTNFDSDNDGQDDAIEAGRDTDGDGVTDNLDANDDNDGIDSVIESQVPERPSADGQIISGDGNGDGVTDTVQPNVTSLPFLHTDTAISNPGDAPPVYVTLAAGGVNNNDVHLTNVTQEDAPPDLPDDPAAPQLPLGLIRFTAELPPDISTQDFELFVPPEVAINGYWKQTAGGSSWANLA